MPPARIRQILAKLYDIDRSIKLGGNPARLLELLVVQHGG
jgi:hypothetical protein